MELHFLSIIYLVGLYFLIWVLRKDLPVKRVCVWFEERQTRFFCGKSPQKWKGSECRSIGRLFLITICIWSGQTSTSTVRTLNQQFFETGSKYFTSGWLCSWHCVCVCVIFRQKRFIKINNTICSFSYLSETLFLTSGSHWNEHKIHQTL